ncbi:MAG: hypothetical protein WBA31_09720 [Candidatus Dormiibacterota bacterium]
MATGRWGVGALIATVVAEISATRPGIRTRLFNASLLVLSVVGNVC